jgi:hypothetical protein
MKGTNLESEKRASEMTKRKQVKHAQSMMGLPEGLSEEQKYYIAALEAELKEQRLRVLLYQGVIISASEELGEDLLKKIGVNRSGP